MIRQGPALASGTQVLYVSPLKALANDIRKNLLEPLAELRALGGSDAVPEIRTAVLGSAPWRSGWGRSCSIAAASRPG